MGCWIRTTRHGTLAVTLYYKGQKWTEGTGEKDTEENRRLFGAFAARVKESMNAGTFAADYPRFFPHGNRINKFQPKAKRGPTLGTFAREFAESRKPPLYRHSYERVVRTHLDCWIVPELGRVPLAQLSRAHVVELAAKMQKRGKSPKTIKNVIGGTLSAILAEAIEHKLTDSNPVLGMKWGRQPKKQIDPFTRDELETILGILAGRARHVYRFVLTLADTGMRPSEATGLQWGDVELKGEGSISINRSRVLGRTHATKTDFSQRTLKPLTARLLAELKDARPLHVTPETPVLVGPTGRPIRQDQLYARHWLKVFSKERGIRPRRLYELRHTFVSLALSGGANPKWVSEYVGSDLRTLERHYGKYMTPRDSNPFGWMGEVEPTKKGGHRVG